MARPPFETGGSGWGSFTIDALIVLRPGYYWAHPDATVGPGDPSLLPLRWTLNFEQQLSYDQVGVQVGEDQNVDFQRRGY